MKQGGREMAEMKDNVLIKNVKIFDGTSNDTVREIVKLHLRALRVLRGNSLGVGNTHL
jgi:hypothetical protein